jgi:hypothetical protein
VVDDEVDIPLGARHESFDEALDVRLVARLAPTDHVGVDAYSQRAVIG